MNGLRERPFPPATKIQVPTEPAVRLLSVEELQTLPPLTWLINQYLPARGLAVLYGPSACGKSFVALDMALSVVTGTRWAGFATTSGPVVYVSAEGAAGLQQRVTAWMQARGVRTIDKGKLRFCLEPVQLMDKSATNGFIQALERTLPSPPSLVIFDTMARCMVGGDENSSQDLGRLVEGVEQVRRSMRAAVLIVHHTGKKGTSERGSSALRASADAMISLQVDGGGTRLRVDKMKDAPVTAPELLLRLKSEGDSCVVTLVEKDPRKRRVLTDQQRRALETLSRLSDVSTANQWKAESGIAASSFYRVIRQLQDLGYVDPSGTGKGYTLTDKGRQALTLT